jgi:GNAT superfamily N-acetyltransferase
MAQRRVEIDARRVERRHPLEIRRGRPEEAETLRAIMEASKAHWGYDRQFVSDWAASVDLSSEKFARHEIYVAEHDHRFLGWAALDPPVDGVGVLDDLWVEPSSMGQGVGARLFATVRERAEQLGAVRLEWDAEPNSVGFYEQMGGRYLRDHVSEWGRITPVMGIDLAGS